MTTVGIEALNIFAGTCYLDVEKLANHRGLDTARFDNLLMKEKTVALPYEDPVTFGVNAAKPLIDALSPEERDRIETGHHLHRVRVRLRQVDEHVLPRPARAEPQLPALRDQERLLLGCRRPADGGQLRPVAEPRRGRRPW